MSSIMENIMVFCRFLSLSKNLNVTVGDKKETFGKESTNALCGRFEGPAERGEFQWIYVKCKKYHTYPCGSVTLSKFMYFHVLQTIM